MILPGVGRRGGVFGSVLAVVVLVLQRAVLLGGAEPWTQVVLVGGAIVVGLAVSRVLELTGRRS